MSIIRNIISLIFIVLFVGCVKDESLEKIVFHVDVSDINAYSAKITVTHNATNRDSYYGFMVKGAVADIQSEIAVYLNTVETSQLAEAIHFQRKSVFSITGLSPQETYTFIVFGMNDDGLMYGEPCSTVFCTLESQLSAQINPNWKIGYMGHAVYNNNDYSRINVNVLGNAEERYFLATYEQDFVESFEQMEDLIVYATNEFIEKMKEPENEGSWFEDSQVRVDGTSFYRYLHEGDYVSFAIGINIDGSPTGNYVKTDCYHVEKYPAVDGFSNLLGEWIITDDNNQFFNVEFTEDIVNKSFILKGFGNVDDCPIIVSFNRIDSSLEIRTQSIKDNFEITFNDGTFAEGKLTLKGVYYDSESKLKWTNQSHSLTKGTLNDDGSYTFKSNFRVTMNDGTITEKTGMTYYIERNNESNIGFGRMMFPLGMRKK